MKSKKCPHMVTHGNVTCGMCPKTTAYYEDKILDIIDHADDFTRSDLQGVVSALVMKMLSNK